jgi:hypothetical protein
VKLQIDGRTYQIPREYEIQIFDQLWNRDALPWYNKTERWIKVAASPITRLVLAFLEGQVEKEAGPDKAKLIRPPARDTDPNLWLGEVMAKMLLEGLNFVTLCCETTENMDTGERGITNFHLELEASGATDSAVEKGPSQAGGLLGPGRNEGIR